MKKLGFLLILVSMMVVAACKMGGKSDKKATAELKNTRWVIETLNNEKIELPKESGNVFFVFQSETPRYNGMAGCNNFGGDYVLGDANSLKFGLPMSTLMACEHMELENAFVAMLATVDSYKIEGDQLSLLGAGKAVATFKPSAALPQ